MNMAKHTLGLVWFHTISNLAKPKHTLQRLFTQQQTNCGSAYRSPAGRMPVVTARTAALVDMQIMSELPEGERACCLWSAMLQGLLTLSAAQPGPSRHSFLVRLLLTC